MAKLGLRDLIDVSPVLAEAAGAIVDDSVTRCFESNPPRSWRQNPYLFPLWFCGVIVRYFILFPFRVALLTVGWIVAFSIIIPATYLFKGHDKILKRIKTRLFKLMSDIFVATWGGIIKYHDTPPSIPPNQVFVANHTSIIDIMVLERAVPFAVIMQKHSGWIGKLQETFLKDIGCISFNRAESKDREFVRKRLEEHVEGDKTDPFLIFPEGTCVNNKYILTFQKGAFEVGCTVTPIAIKYHNTFVDPFLNSKKVSFTKYLLHLMTSWAVLGDVWFLEPQKQKPGETAIEFAERVRDLISAKAGLEKLPMEGYLKHSRPRPKHMLLKQQKLTELMMQKMEQ
uniref:Phospholipid/glycerol acyltransferase domain-containing protein n=1 Tax=Kalanchoe fedtschenkoi TaxID=63787 RepID=A0A7N0U5M4_KALFE